MTDAELLRRWHATRDAEAFHTLVRRYSGLVYGSARRILKSEADAEDVTQECFERLATKRIVPRRSLGAWLHRVAVNRALDRRKAERRRQDREHRYAEQQPTAQDDVWDDLAPLIDEAVNRLPRAERDVIVAYFYLQRTQADIARDLNLSRRAVSHRIQRAVARLRAILANRGIQVSAATLASLATDRLAEAAPLPVAKQLGRLALAGHHAARGSAVFVKLANAALAHKTAAIIAVAAFVIGSAYVARIHSAPAVATRGNASQPPPTAQVPAQRRAADASIANQVSSTASATAAVELQTGTIVGRVVESTTGQGIPAIVVHARPLDPRRTAIQGATDGLGRYRFAGLPPGRYEIRTYGDDKYRRPDLGLKEFRTEIAAGQTVTMPVIELTQGLAVTGRVVTAQGRPIGSARVYAYTREPESDAGANAAPDGSFRIAGLTASTQTFLYAMADGFAMEQVGPFDITGAGPHRFELVMAPHGVIHGVISDPDGVPVEGIAVVPSQVGRSYSRTWFDFTPSDSRGEFKVWGLHPGKYRLDFALKLRSGYRTLPTKDAPTVDIGAGDVLDDLRLTYSEIERLSLSGTILTPDGDPVYRARVTLSPDGAASPTFEASSDKEGRFEVTNLAPGTYDLFAIHYTFGEQHVTGLQAGSTDARVVLPKRVNVSGVVVDADTGDPVASFALAEMSRRIDYRQVMEWVDFVQPEGHFVLEGVQPGNRTILARAKGYLPTNVSISLRAGEPEDRVRIRLQPARVILGKVVDMSGRPVQDAEVSFVPADGTGLGPSDFENIRSKSGGDGLFQLDLPPGLPGSLKADHPLYASALLSTAQNDPGPYTLMLGQGGEARGQFLWNGSPVSGADARIQFGYRIIRHLNTDAQGGFRFTGLDAGKHVVLLGGTLREGPRPLYANAFQPVEVRAGQASERDVILAGADTRVRGVLTANGQPWSLGRQRVFLTYDDSQDNLRNYYVYLDEEGAFDVEGVPTGWAKVEVSRPGLSKLHIADVFIEEANPLDLQFDVDLSDPDR